MMKFDAAHAHLQEDINSYQPEVSRLHKMIVDKTGAGNDYMGWVDWPVNYDRDEFQRMLATAERVKDKAEVLLVCGIGDEWR